VPLVKFFIHLVELLLHLSNVIFEVSSVQVVLRRLFHPTQALSTLVKLIELIVLLGRSLRRNKGVGP